MRNSPKPDFCVHGILKKFDVRVVGTTDDPADPLDDHAAIAASDLKTLVAPTFRPDKALLVDRPDLLDAMAGETGSDLGH